jgi:outer membrane receptor protein involved in Fe transport
MLLLAYVVPTVADDKVHDHATHEDDETIEEIIVWGRALTQKGTALSAAEGLVGYADFSTRTLQRVGELVEVVPGMVATQHSGEGKANQYFLRGMNLDHGTDFSAYFEGMPVNFRSHAHGQGYLDLNFLIPEVMSTVRYAKGPYHADRGDFSTAGTTALSVYDRLDSPFVEVTGGSDAFGRVVAAGSMDFDEGHLLAAIEVARNDGPWDNESNVEKTNFLSKYSGHWDEFETQLLFTYYDNEWKSTDQVPDRLVSAGLLDRFGFVDPDLGGATTRVNLIGGLQSDNFNAAAYVSRYKLNLFGNFTYFAEDPVNGDQHEQVDRRWVYGGFAEYTIELNDMATLKVGGDLRNDDISDANLYQTTARVRRVETRKDNIGWLSVGAYSQLEVLLSDRLRTTFGVRMDHYRYDVSALNPVNSGNGNDTNFLPSIGVAYELNEFVELYANWGQGFHSNDVRGRTISVDPVSGDPVAPVDLFVEQQGAEVGMRLEGWHGLAVTLGYFWLESDSELLFLGDSGSTEPADASERTGVELSAFWNIDERWTADLIGTFVDSSFIGVPSGFDHIPNAQGRVIGVGLTYAEA